MFFSLHFFTEITQSLIQAIFCQRKKTRKMNLMMIYQISPISVFIGINPD